MQVKALGAERRRRWSYEEKVRLIEETLQPGETVCGVARRHGLAESLVFTASAGPSGPPGQGRASSCSSRDHSGTGSGIDVHSAATVFACRAERKIGNYRNRAWRRLSRAG
jgi:transposase